MITRYYIREISTGLYYFLFHGAEGFLPQIEDAYIFNSRNDVLLFFEREENLYYSVLEGRVLEIVEIFLF
jgi:hypothetical protein